MSRLEKKLAEQRGKRSSLWKRMFAVFALMIAFVAVAGASYYWFSGGFTKSKEAGTLLTSQNKINIMIMGVDERDDDVGRSDTLFVVTVDTNTKQVAMLSVPRDTRVKIPGHGWDKINHAYPLGGHQLTQKAVEALLGIKMDHYVMINIAGFKKIVDAIGGVDINVEKRMYYIDPYDNNGKNGEGLVIDLRPGLQHMDGETAIQYVRYRDEEGDIGRVERQQKFLKAVMAEVTSPSVITKIPAIIREVSSVIKSDMSTGEMLNLAKALNDASKKGLKTDMVPGKPAYINEVSYWIPDIMALRQHVAQTLGVNMEEKYVAATKKEVVEYETSIPKEMKIIEVPKEPEKPKTPDSPDNPEKIDKPKTTEPGKPTTPSKPTTKTPSVSRISVEIVNASGDGEAGDRMAATLRAQGFEIVSVSGMTNTYKNTVVVSNTTDSAVINKLSGLPFKHSVQISREDGKSPSAVVYIGKDYVNKQ